MTPFLPLTFQRILTTRKKDIREHRRVQGQRNWVSCLPRIFCEQARSSLKIHRLLQFLNITLRMVPALQEHKTYVTSYQFETIVTIKQN